MQKMKKRKKLVLFISMIFIALFVSANSSALTTHTVEYPSEVTSGDMFTINLIFDYPSDTDCMYSETADFHWSINSEIIPWTNKLRKSLPDYPRPTNISWTFDSSIFSYGSLEVGDIIRFKFVFTTGTILNNNIYLSNITRTSVYELTIVEAVTEQTSAVGIITSMFVLAAIVIFIRKKKVDSHA